ncbi:MAG TPA: aldo/keto reductase [Steroidobacteraceae bacterium]|nr:aldo/keto reductase [Steroidobacteraceae bacterium]
MRYRKLGNTGLIVSEMCLGAMTFGTGEGMWATVGSVSQDGGTDLVKTALDNGINFIDTADFYSNGRSEEVTGHALKKLGLARDSYVLATKVLLRMGAGHNQIGLSRYHIMQGVDQSLKRLQLDHIDLYQIHGRDPFTPLEETLDALDDCVRAGKVRYLGLCNLPAWEVAKSLWISDKKNLARFESLQIYYSVVSRDIERELVPLAKDQNLAILPWSPLSGGLLSGKFSRENEKPDGARRATFDFPPVEKERLWRVLDVIRPIAKARNVSVAQVALAWLLAQPHVTSVILGAKNREQLVDNIGAAKVTLSPADLQSIDEASALPSEYPQWMLTRQSNDRLTQVLGTKG